MDPDEVAAGCFEFRLRTRSFDLHQLTQGSKLKKFGRLFRASSDGGVKQSSSVPSSPAAGSSPRHSPPRRRRFVRVIRDKPEDCTEDGRYVVHKYSEQFLAQMNRERFVTHTFMQLNRSVCAYWVHFLKTSCFFVISPMPMLSKYTVSKFLVSIYITVFALIIRPL